LAALLGARDEALAAGLSLAFGLWSEIEPLVGVFAHALQCGLGGFPGGVARSAVSVFLSHHAGDALGVGLTARWAFCSSATAGAGAHSDVVRWHQGTEDPLKLAVLVNRPRVGVREGAFRNVVVVEQPIRSVVFDFAPGPGDQSFGSCEFRSSVVPSIGLEVHPRGQVGRIGTPDPLVGLPSGAFGALTHRLALPHGAVEIFGVLDARSTDDVVVLEGQCSFAGVPCRGVLLLKCFGDAGEELVVLLDRLVVDIACYRTGLAAQQCKGVLAREVFLPSIQA